MYNYRDLSTLDPSWVRGSIIGYINQEPVLFATSVMENIRYGKLSATDSEVCIIIVTILCYTRMSIIIVICIDGRRGVYGHFKRFQNYVILNSYPISL